MIEMSVDKETVLPGDGGVDHLQPQQPTECTDSCHTTAGASVASVCSMAVISSSMVVTEEMANSTDTVGGTVELGSSTGGNPFQPRNGLKQPPQQQALPRSQPHPPKLSKRRNTTNAGFKHPGSGKRRRRANSESDPVLPTNFLLGGNIFDPLNLNSLMDEEVNRALNAETPKSSPLPARSRDPVEILIPRDITDPLNLNCGSGLDGGILVSPVKSGGRKRHRNRHHGGVGGATGTQLEPSEPDKAKAEDVGSAVPEGKALEGPGEGTAPLDPVAAVDSPRPYELNTSINCWDTAVLHPVLSHGLADPGSLTSSVALPQQLSSRQRKRRRASSRCDPGVAAPRKGDGEQGREPGKPPTSFLTLVGSGGTLQPQGRRRRQQKKFQYGNYNKYYGYRNPGRSEDPRARVLRPEWFRGKEVLDLGCNTGHLTLSIARNWLPARIVGLDIDGALVHAARQNVRHYLSEVQAQESRQASKTGTESDSQKLDGPMAAENKAAEEEEEDRRHKGEEDNPVSIERTGRESMEESGGGHPFPVSLRISRGPIAAPPLPDSPPAPPGIFPANISFIRGNYVLESDTLLQTQQPEYDVILCLSVTKWVHLNWGDVGVQRLFRRVYKHLRPGGLFILEPQPWASYSKRKKLTDTIYKNYHNIRFRPDQFSSYLTSEVGFSSYELIGTPKTCSRGFQRPIYLFHKGPSSHRK